MSRDYSKFFGGAVTVGAVFCVAVAVALVDVAFALGTPFAVLAGREGPCVTAGAVVAVVAAVVIGSQTVGGAVTVVVTVGVAAVVVAIAVVCVGCKGVACVSGFVFDFIAKLTPTASTTSAATPAPTMIGRRCFFFASSACVVPHAVPPVPIFGFDPDEIDEIDTIGGRDGRFSVDAMRSLDPRATSDEYGSSDAASSATFENRFFGSFSRHFITTALRPSGISERALFGESG